MTEHGVPSASIVTRGQEELVTVDAGVIEVLPAWRFLLGLEESRGPSIE